MPSSPAGTVGTGIGGGGAAPADDFFAVSQEKSANTAKKQANNRLLRFMVKFFLKDMSKNGEFRGEGKAKRRNQFSKSLIFGKIAF
jgi:hypothetical protein